MEFVFIALVVFVPLIYVVAGFSAVQRGVFASTAAEREAGRAIATAPDPVYGQERALRAAQLAVEDQSVDASGLTLVVVRCSGSVPALLASLGNLLPLEVTGRAVKEAA